MKIAVCDDEPIFRKQLKAILEEYYCSLDVLVLSYSSGEELLGAVKGNPFDLVFLDIEMEGIDGLETAKRLNELVSDLPVILLTSHTELAMEGYEVRAFRFLGKPVDKRKLQEALGAFEKLRQQEQKIEIVTEGGSRRQQVSVSYRYPIHKKRECIFADCNWGAVFSGAKNPEGTAAGAAGGSVRHGTSQLYCESERDSRF